MRKLVVVLIVLVPFYANAQDADYAVKSYLKEGVKAPNSHHLGDAWLNFLIEAGDSLDYNITEATFSENATLDWHKHQTAQVLIVVAGKGYYQERGKEPLIMNKGDVIKCDKNTEHWHSSSAYEKVSYIAIYGRQPTVWTEKLTREYYDSVARKLSGK